MKTTNLILAAAIASVMVTGCAEIPMMDVVDSGDTIAAVDNSNAFTVLSDAEHQARIDTAIQIQAVQQGNIIQQSNSRENVKQFSDTSELNSHLGAVVTDITYAGESGYFFTVTQYLGESQDHAIDTFVNVSHDEITEHGTIFECVGGYVSQCNL